jgi:hypothetical protein
MQFLKSAYQTALTSLVISLSTITFAADLSPQEVMDKVDQQAREVSDATLSKSQLSSCDFAIKNKKVLCTETPRLKTIESLSKQRGDAKKDAQSISIVLEPASESGIGMLTYSYDDSSKDTESWLYLSALGKVKRMASGTGEDQEPVSLFGSEFTTEDMENGKTDEYDYKLLQSGQYQGREVWVIEAKPKPVRYAKTNYGKLLYWIDQERYLPLKVQTYDKRGTLHKRIMASDHELINGHWLSRDLTIYNLKRQRLSNMKTDKIAVNVSFDPDFLTQRTLTDFAYRERVLQSLRNYFQ